MSPPFIRTGTRWPSERVEGEKDEGEDEEELDAAVVAYCDKKLAPVGPGVAAGTGSPPGSMEPV